jgi:hypothetical protein
MLLAVRLNVLTKSFVDLLTSFHEKSTKSENLSNLKDKKERIELTSPNVTQILFFWKTNGQWLAVLFLFFKGLSD